jgi:hypothetical protein
MTKIDVSSTMLEKGIDLIKGFVEKLAGGTMEETGLLFAEKIRLRRLKNQIEILKKAQKIAKEANINIKQINLKVLVPLLENCSLEEEESIQDMWANLIANYADSNKTYHSAIYPFILSQLSSDEVKQIEEIYGYKVEGTTQQFKLDKEGINNLVRLGILEKGNPKITFHPRNFLFNKHDKIEVDETPAYKMTSLGRKFYECCTNK